MTYDDSHDFRLRRGFPQKDWKAVSKTRLAAKGEASGKRKHGEEGAMNTSETLPGKLRRAVVGAVGNSEELLGAQEERRRVGDLHCASVAGKEEAEEHVQWRNPA